MKKIVVNISDSIYEKLKFEAIKEKMDIQSLIKQRIFYKPFDIDVEEAFNQHMDKDFSNIFKD